MINFSVRKLKNRITHSTNAQLSFSITGENGTNGYADICIGKRLVTDPSTIQAYIDDKPANYTVSSTADSWILNFSYHSSHHIQFDLRDNENESVPEMQEQAWTIALVILFVDGSYSDILQKNEEDTHLNIT